MKTTTVKKTPGTQYGTYAVIKGEVTEEKLVKAKEIVVDEICEFIKEIANKSEDFFIINNLEDATTVASKFILPTVEEAVELSEKKVVTIK